MLEDACVEIEVLTEKDRQERAHKYARRNRMRYIDQLLNELEMLNLAEQARMPDRLSVAVGVLIEETRALVSAELPELELPLRFPPGTRQRPGSI